METRFIRFIACLSSFIVALLNYQCTGQKISIPSDQIFIGGVNNQMGMNECKKTLGEPLKLDLKTYEIGPDGLDEGYSFTYDSLKVTYIKFYGEILMSNISATGRKIKIQIANYQFYVGDSVSILDPLINSKFNCEEIIKDKEGHVKRLVFDVVTLNDNSSINGSMSIEIEQDRIVRVGIVFDEELT